MITVFNNRVLNFSGRVINEVFVSQTPTPINSSTPTQTPTVTITATPSFTPTNTQTPTFTPTRTITPTPTQTSGLTPTRTQTPTFTPTRTATRTPTQTTTQTRTPTQTTTQTRTPTQTPTPSPAPFTSINLKLLILGDSSVSSVASNISSQLTTLRYSDFTISGITMGTTYSASGFTPSDYNCVLYYTNSGQVGSSSLSSNLFNYINSGGSVVTATFTWNLRPAGWSDSNLTAFVGPVNQTFNNMNVNILSGHPIFSGVSSAITSNNSYFCNDVVSIQSGATTLANFSSNNRPFLSIKNVGSSRLVSVNTHPPGISSYAPMRRLFTNSVLWAVGII